MPSTTRRRPQRRPRLRPRGLTPYCPPLDSAAPVAVLVWEAGAVVVVFPVPMLTTLLVPANYEFSTDGGTNWTPVASITQNSATVLSFVSPGLEDNATHFRKIADAAPEASPQQMTPGQTIATTLV